MPVSHRVTRPVFQIIETVLQGLDALDASPSPSESQDESQDWPQDGSQDWARYWAQDEFPFEQDASLEESLEESEDEYEMVSRQGPYLFVVEQEGPRRLRNLQETRLQPRRI